MGGMPLFNLIQSWPSFYGTLAVKMTKIPLKTTQAEIPNISSVWALHDKMKKLDFSGGFLSVIRTLVGMLF